MAVHRSQARDREGVWRNLPREPETEEGVRLVDSEERSDPLACGWDDYVEVGRCVADELVVLVPVSPRVFARAENGDRLVSEGAEQLRQAVDGRRNL